MPTNTENTVEEEDSNLVFLLFLLLIVLGSIAFGIYYAVGKYLKRHTGWSDSKGSVIDANDTPSFPLFMSSSASAVELPYPHSWWKVIHLLCLSFIFYLLGPEKYTVTIHLNENHLVVIITLHRQTLQVLYSVTY